MNIELLGVALYVLAMLGVGFVVSKKIKTDEDYFLAGRTLGPYLATFSIFATWFGAESCIGSAGAVYRMGLGSVHADPVGYTICIFLMGFLFSRILWNKKITTIPDLYRNRFSPATERMAAIIMIPSSIIWSGAQIRAFGQILQATTDYGFTISVTVAALVVIIYTIFGGLLADAYNDLIQGFTMIAGLLFLLIAIIWDMGGIGSAMASVSPERLNIIHNDPEVSFLGHLELWMVPILGSLMAQELVSRVVSSRSSDVAFNSCIRAGFIYLAVGIIPVMIGLVGPHYYPGLQDSETIMPMLAKTHLNSFFYVLFVGALVSAILSTIDSTLLSVSALVSHNIISMKNPTEKQKVLLARGGVFISGLISYGIAFTSDSITGLVELASSLGGPSILVITSIALFVKKGNATNAIIAMTASLVTWVAFNFIWVIDYPVIMTICSCALGYFASLLFTGHKSIRPLV
jgi:solute:Na+ symporter, SSS family